MPTHRRPLWRNRDFVLLLSGQAISSAGTEVSQLAFPLLLLYRRMRLSAPAFRHGDGHPLARQGDLCTAALIVVCPMRYH